MRTTYFHPVVSSIFYLLLSSFLFSSPNLSRCRLPYLHTWCDLTANLECRSETCCTRIAEYPGRKYSQKNRHLCTIAQLCRALSSQLTHVSTIGKKNLYNISSACPDNTVTFGSPTAEIGSLVWRTPANFKGFCVLAALLHRIVVVSVSQLCGVEQRAPPIFGRMAIALGIGPHSRLFKQLTQDC